MAKVVGIDPGTGSMDLLGLDDTSMRVFLDVSIPRQRVTQNPSIILEVLEDAGGEGLDAIVAPSGYGIPLKRVQEASEGEIVEASFMHSSDRRRHQIIGLRQLMMMLKRSRLKAWFTPGVIHLQTVPRYRKMWRIDIGTADKVYTVAAALRDEVERHGTPLHEADFIVVEAGMAYNAAIAVVGGRIVDGIGGTTGWWGFLGPGFMDSELAYILSHASPSFPKSLLFTGGASTLSGYNNPEDLASAYLEGDEKAMEAVEMLIESILKDVAALLPVVRKPRRIYVSGRLTRINGLGHGMIEALKGFLNDIGVGATVERITRLGKNTKEGATGAALIASGLAGGRYRWIIESLGLKNSQGSILDNMHGLEGLRRALG